MTSAALRSPSVVVRSVLCVLVWALPFVATWGAYRLTDGPGDVNMFGMTRGQHDATFVTLGIAIVAVVVLSWLLRLGHLWLLAALGTAIALMLVLGLIDDHLVAVPRAVSLTAVLVVTPLVGALVTTPRRGRAQPAKVQ